MPPLTYKDAGVDLELYEQAMERLPALMKRTHTPRVMPLVGGFAGLFQLNGAGKKYDDPVLVSGTDGVGTKIKVAVTAGRYNTIGIDLVAMCVNDCLCLGAEPLFFLDYLALPKDDPDLIAALVEGVSEGCVRGGMALLGGETAIMPALYAAGEFDMAGFCVGVAERSKLVDGKGIQPGDVVLGVASSGCHSNGYSLVRKVVFEAAGLKPDDFVPELNRSVADALLEPTVIYSQAVAAAMEAGGSALHGMAHITGGGLAENIARILPENRRLLLSRGSWETPPVFGWLQRLGNIPQEEMLRVFNMGIGYTFVTARESLEAVRQAVAEQQLAVWEIGHIVEGEAGVEFVA